MTSDPTRIFLSRASLCWIALRLEVTAATDMCGRHSVYIDQLPVSGRGIKISIEYRVGFDLLASALNVSLSKSDDSELGVLGSRHTSEIVANPATLISS